MTVGIRDVKWGSLNYHHLQRIYVLPTSNLKVDLSHVNVGELSTELQTVQDISGSACHILNALPLLRYHGLIVVDVLRLVVCVCVCVVCVCVCVCMCACLCVCP